ncbi:hypothetical protein [Rhizorhapis sp. SPR117]|uniref:hypothetical protein n=1 Tax=Rhizorhapis sp. SPR117 TaxID=2912611 RepID=UPI001F1DB823|nr:hypothetical protein [Rhizorhapis sp. SPR117]
MIPVEPRLLTAAQQFLHLQRNPLCPGDGTLHAGGLAWRFALRPTPLSREYGVRIDYHQGQVPDVFVEDPDLTLLAGDRTLPHVYSQKPTRLCLYLPRAFEWRDWMRLDETIVPWIAIWLFYFEEWLTSNAWKGGGEHPDHPRSRRRRPGRR